MTTHGDAIRRRQIAHRLLDRLDTLSFIPALGWLRFVRVALILAAVGCLVIGWPFYALLALAAWTPVEIAIGMRSLVEVAKGWRE